MWLRTQNISGYRQTYSATPNYTGGMFWRTKIAAKLYPRYSLVCDKCSHTIPQYSLAMISYANAYPLYSLATLFVRQTIPR